jgi:hypothetical protein
MFRSLVNRALLAGIEAAAAFASPVLNRVALRQAKNIPLERNHRALISTVDFILKHMPKVKGAHSKFELLENAFRKSNISGSHLICEFGVFTGTTINHLARMTSQRIYGFDSFQGLPEEWSNMVDKGHFALKSLPSVRNNVILIKGWFSETLPAFLNENAGPVGFLHVDCDLYSSTKTVFDLMEPRLVPGTIIVFDEYLNYSGWEEGEHKAFQEFLQRTQLSCEYFDFALKGEQVAVILREKQ